MTLHLEDVFQEIDRIADQITQTLADLIRIPAISPDNGGKGESEKAEKLANILGKLGFDNLERYDAVDPRFPGVNRPNLIANVKGKRGQEKLWIISHLDIVPPGEPSLWTVTRPFEPLVKDGKIFGRGSEDNTQSTVASIFAMKALKNLDIEPTRTVGLCFVADEEQGSKYGIQHLIGQQLFDKNDLIVVPDGGNADGSFIEIAEKSSLWVRIKTMGRQTHASRPSAGLNAHRIGMQYAIAVDETLHKRYSDKDAAFDPPESTFEPTKKLTNIDAINIVPGEDILYFDCRVLPRYELEEILEGMEELASQYESKTGATIKIEKINMNQAPPPTDPNARVVRLLEQAIMQSRNLKPQIGGIGGGTCAAFFRRTGIPAAVWSTEDEVAHQPNEYAKIENLVKDAKTFAALAIV